MLVKSKREIKLQSDKYEVIVSCRWCLRWRKQYGKPRRSSGSKQWRTWFLLHFKQQPHRQSVWYLKRS